MSPIWIPWIVFWAVALFVMFRVFASAARQDRITQNSNLYLSWSTENLIRLTEQIEGYDDQGKATAEDLERQEAAIIELARRAKS